MVAKERAGAGKKRAVRVTWLGAEREKAAAALLCAIVQDRGALV